MKKNPVSLLFSNTIDAQEKMMTTNGIIVLKRPSLKQ
jgi:hypothetical protein